MNKKANPTDHVLEEAVDWFLSLRDRPDDVELQSQFSIWVAKDDDNARAYERVRCLMGDTKALHEKQHATETISASSRPVTGIRHVLMLILAIAGASFGAYHFIGQKGDHVTGVAERATLTAPDGSRLTLNAATAIDLQFSDKERRVVLLRGEIFVDVVPDGARPFVVEANGGTTTALGTAFDVDLRDDRTIVSVAKHSVAVQIEGREEQKIVGESQELNYNPDRGLSEIIERDSASFGQWRNGRLVFEDESIADVVGSFSRYLRGTMIISSRKIGTKRVSGNLDMTNPDEALTSFAQAFQIKIMRITPFVTILH